MKRTAVSLSAAWVAGILAAGSAFATAACSKSACSDCENSVVATLQLACVPDVPPAVEVTGACTVGSVVGSQVSVFASAAGICHVTFTFAGGAMTSTDVTFTATDRCTPCEVMFVASPAVIQVAGPPSSCADAGVPGDAGAE